MGKSSSMQTKCSCSVKFMDQLSSKWQLQETIDFCAESEICISSMPSIETLSLSVL